MTRQQIVLVPEQRSRAKLVFKTDREYQQFCTDFRASVKPEMDRQAETRRRSEERAKSMLVR